MDLSGRRALATAELTDGWVVATDHGLHVLSGETVTVRAWTDVDGARLVDTTLTVTWVDGTPPTALALVDDRRARLPRLVHNRVQASVVHSERVPLPGAESVRVALRRDTSGALFTQVIGTGAVDLHDPEVARLVDAAESRVREAAGL